MKSFRFAPEGKVTWLFCVKIILCALISAFAAEILWRIWQELQAFERDLTMLRYLSRK